MYGRGHCTGTRRTRPAATAWYAEIEREAIAQVDRQWTIDYPETRQEVIQDKTQATGTTDQVAGSMHHEHGIDTTQHA